MANKGIVVDHKETDVRYAISERNFNRKIHTYVRDLKPGETVIGFTPKPRLQHAQEEAEAAEGLAQWREELAAAKSGQTPEAGEQAPYPEWRVPELKAEITSRNETREDDDRIIPDSDLKADLIAALELDDEAQNEGDSTPE